MFTVAVALVLAQEPGRVPGAGASDAEYCAFLAPRAASTSKYLPWATDGTTRIDGMSVDCPRRTVSYDKFISADLSEDWRQGLQEDWNEFVCGKDVYGPMARQGWRFSQNLTFQTGERLTQDARC